MTWPPLRMDVRPVAITSGDGEHREVAPNTCLKRIPSLARRSMWGVFTSGLAKEPESRAPWSSKTIMTRPFQRSSHIDWTSWINGCGNANSKRCRFTSPSSPPRRGGDVGQLGTIKAQERRLDLANPQSPRGNASHRAHHTVILLVNVSSSDRNRRGRVEQLRIMGP